MKSNNHQNPSPSNTTHNSTVDMLPNGVRRSTLLRLAFMVNSMADCSSQGDLSFPEVHAAAQEGRLLELLHSRSPRFSDFSYLKSPDGSFDELNSALRLSSTVLQHCEFTKAGVSRNGYCLALAIVFYAIRERLVDIWPERPARANTPTDNKPASDQN